MKAVLCRPFYDLITGISFSWAELVLDCLSRSGCEVTDLILQHNNKKELSQHLNDSQLFIFYGHGKSDKLIGQSGFFQNALVDINNIQQFREKIVYTMACSSAKHLGIRALESGAVCYFGYDDLFGVIITSSKHVQGFKEAANIGIIELVNKNAEEAHQSMLNKFEQWVEYWKSHPDAYAALTIAWLLHNKNHCKLLGNPNSRLGGENAGSG